MVGVLNVHSPIDPDEVTVPSVVQQIVNVSDADGGRAELHGRRPRAVWNTVSRPFRHLVDDVVSFPQDVNNEYKEK